MLQCGCYNGYCFTIIIYDTRVSHHAVYFQVLIQAQKEILNYESTGVSVMGKKIKFKIAESKKTCIAFIYKQIFVTTLFFVIN